MPYIKQIKSYETLLEQEKADKEIILDFIEQYPNTILTRKNKMAHITSSGLILNKELDKMLMIHHNIYDTWTWTGGHADGDRDLLEIAIKEAKEETGLKNIIAQSGNIASIDILPVFGHVKNGEYISVHNHLNVSYVLIADEKEELKVNTEETSGVKWVEIESIADYSKEDYFIDIYNKIIEKGKQFKGNLD